MPTSKILLRLQSIVADRRMRWAHDPQLWVELFVTTNLAILAADIYIAHSVNHFQKAAEYIPLYFSIGAPVVLAVTIFFAGSGTSKRRGAILAIWLAGFLSWLDWVAFSITWRADSFSIEL